MAAPSIAESTSVLLYDEGNAWTGSQVTFSFPRPGSLWPGYAADDEPSSGAYAAPTDLQVAAFRLALQAWDDVVALRLVETDDLTAAGQIRIAFTDVSARTGNDEASAYAYRPPEPGVGASNHNGDIWLDDGLKASVFTPGSLGFEVLLHELGHALALQHPFGPGALLPEGYDNTRFTVMAYKDFEDSIAWTAEPTAEGGRFKGQYVEPSTPMVFDIAAIQARYGADPATAAGDTIYTFDQNTPFMRAIYDAGGSDTIDLSGHTRSSIIDLTPGAYSSIAYYSREAQEAYWTSLYPGGASVFHQTLSAADTYTWSNNLGIAYGTVIENVLGGSAADTILGNDAGNYLSGGGGNDFLRGFLGDDSIVGGEGFDDTQEGGDGVDWVRGGQGNDSLSGGADDDWMSGDLGDDTLSGGSGRHLPHLGRHGNRPGHRLQPRPGRPRAA